MARVKLSEYDAKKLIFPALGLDFVGQQLVVATPLSQALQNTNLVVKVDQGVKKRGKQGLVKVNVTARDLPAILKEWTKLGWSQFFVEPVVEHAASAEHYLAFERVRDGWQISYGEQGGIDVEKSWDSVTRTVLKGTPKLPIPPATLTRLLECFETYHLVFVEMNPVLIRQRELIPLDVAAEIDSAALMLPEVAQAGLTPIEDRGKVESERAVATLDAATPASLKFKLLNPDGRIWMLLSGGGASLVLADEVSDMGMGSELANYGEYSGAPTDDDVYAYTKIILTALLQAVSRKPFAIIIAGGVANFTDVAKTFRGLIRALKELQSELVRAQVKIFVRRGGPNETAGLKLMHDFLTQAGLLGSVHGHDTPLTQVVTEVRDYLGRDPKESQ